MKRLISLLLTAVMLMAAFTACAPQQDNSEVTDIVIDESLLLDGNVLSQNIVHALSNKSTPEEPQFSYLEFVVRCGAVCQQEDFCYYNYFPVDNQTGDAEIKIDLSRKMVKQVFDIEWDITQNLGGGYVVTITDDAVYFPTEISWGLLNYHTREYIYSEFAADNTQVVSHFELLAPDDSSGDLGNKSIGDYKIIYDIMTENGETFLRFNRFEKAQV